jgi:hypothetical protein
MEPEGSFQLSQLPKNCSILRQIDPFQVQTNQFPKIHLNIILHFYAWIQQVVSLHKFSLPKPCSYDVANTKIYTRIEIFYLWPTFVQA